MKFDGHRCQLHTAGDDVIIFSRNGRAHEPLPGQSGCGAHPSLQARCDRWRSGRLQGDGTPDFRALHSRNYTQKILCVWAGRSTPNYSALPKGPMRSHLGMISICSGGDMGVRTSTGLHTPLARCGSCCRSRLCSDRQTIGCIRMSSDSQLDDCHRNKVRH